MKYDFLDFLYCPVRYFQTLLKFDKNILHLGMFIYFQLHKIADSDIISQQCKNNRLLQVPGNDFSTDVQNIGQ